jgi:hypothetical protein
MCKLTLRGQHVARVIPQECDAETVVAALIYIAGRRRVAQLKSILLYQRSSLAVITHVTSRLVVRRNYKILLDNLSIEFVVYQSQKATPFRHDHAQFCPLFRVDPVSHWVSYASRRPNARSRIFEA